jgi:hypothetical protein
VRSRLILGIVAFALVAGAAVGDVAASSQRGRISGVTQISFGCPGPVREGAPSCARWARFPHARFAVARLADDNTPVAGTQQIISSGDRGQFTIVLPSGRYLLRPLPAQHTRGGASVRVAVQPARTSWALVRFVGFPQML